MHNSCWDLTSVPHRPGSWASSLFLPAQLTMSFKLCKQVILVSYHWSRSSGWEYLNSQSCRGLPSIPGNLKNDLTMILLIYANLWSWCTLGHICVTCVPRTRKGKEVCFCELPLPLFSAGRFQRGKVPLWPWFSRNPQKSISCKPEESYWSVSY